MTDMLTRRGNVGPKSQTQGELYMTTKAETGVTPAQAQGHQGPPYSWVRKLGKRLVWGFLSSLQVLLESLTFSLPISMVLFSNQHRRTGVIRKTTFSG